MTKISYLLVLFFLGSLFMSGFGSALDADDRFYCGGAGGFYGMYGGSYFGWIVQILIVAALVLFIVWITGQLIGGKHGR